MTQNKAISLFLTFAATFIFGLVVTVAFAAGAASERSIPLSERVLTECEILDVSEATGHTDDVLAILHSNGYYGIAGDGGEILYSDACISEGYIP